MARGSSAALRADRSPARRRASATSVGKGTGERRKGDRLSDADRGQAIRNFARAGKPAAVQSLETGTKEEVAKAGEPHRSREKGTSFVQRGGPVEAPAREPFAGRMEGEAAQASRNLDAGVGENGPPHLRQQSRREEGTQPQAALENHQRQDLPVGRMPEEELQIARSERPVDQRDGAGQAKRR